MSDVIQAIAEEIISHLKTAGTSSSQALFQASTTAEGMPEIARALNTLVDESKVIKVATGYKLMQRCSDDGTANPKKTRVNDRIIEFLSEQGPATTDQIAKGANTTHGTTTVAVSHLQQQGKIVGAGRDGRKKLYAKARNLSMAPPIKIKNQQDTAETTTKSNVTRQSGNNSPRNGSLEASVTRLFMLERYFENLGYSRFVGTFRVTDQWQQLKLLTSIDTKLSMIISTEQPAGANETFGLTGDLAGHWLIHADAKLMEKLL